MRKNRRRARHSQFDSGPLSAKSLAQFDPDGLRPDVHVVARSGYPAVPIRFPVGFRDACNVGGSVGFASFALWLSALRGGEPGPISKQIVEDMATGRWGMVTNNSEVFIDANLYTDDIVEGTIWITELTGPDRATTNLHVEWCRVDGETRTHIGWSAMQTTGGNPSPRWWWRGTADAAVLPRFHRADDDSDGGEERRCPHTTEGRRSWFLDPLGSDGAAQSVPARNPRCSRRRCRTETSGQHLLRRRSGELRCVHTRVEHLREVMLFDDVLVTMSLTALYERGIDLEPEYFQGQSGRITEKLSDRSAQNRLTMPGAPGELEISPPSKLPQSLIDSVLEAIDGNDMDMTLHGMQDDFRANSADVVALARWSHFT
ncbi:unnamed protein product, partial [Mesorhabditis spiculigera]